MNIVITPSTKTNKKFTAKIDDKKTIHFGDNRYQDFNITKDDKKKSLFL